MFLILMYCDEAKDEVEKRQQQENQNKRIFTRYSKSI